MAGDPLRQGKVTGMAQRRLKSADPRDTALEAVAGRLREALDRKQWNQADLARAIEAKETTVSEWTRGKTWPGGWYLLQIVEALRCSATWLLTGQGHPMDGFVAGDPRRTVQALRRGALLSTEELRRRLNEIERRWALLSEEDALDLMARNEDTPT